MEEALRTRALPLKGWSKGCDGASGCSLKRGKEAMGGGRRELRNLTRRGGKNQVFESTVLSVPYGRC